MLHTYQYTRVLYGARPKLVLPSKIHCFIMNIPAVVTPLGQEEAGIRVSEAALLPPTIIKHSHIRGFLGKFRLSEGVVLCSLGRCLLACDTDAVHSLSNPPTATSPTWVRLFAPASFLLPYFFNLWLNAKASPVSKYLVHTIDVWNYIKSMRLLTGGNIGRG